LELTEIFRILRRRRVMTLLVILAALAGAVGIDLSSKAIPTGTATTQILVDSPQSALADLQQDTGPLSVRASVFAQAMTSRLVLDSIARADGIPSGDLTAEGPYSGPAQALNVPTPSPARSAQLIAAKPLYRLTFVAQAAIPIITVAVQGPSAAAAGRLGNSVYPGVRSWLDSLQTGDRVPPSKRVTIRQLGSAQTASINSSTSTVLAAVGAIAILMLGALFIAAFDTRARRRARAIDASSAGSPDVPVNGVRSPVLPPTTPVPAEADGVESPALRWTYAP
jgi:capsular polysaccharide biosynthesis protein